MARETLSETEQKELDAILGRLLLPTFTPREVDIARSAVVATLAIARRPLEAECCASEKNWIRAQRDVAEEKVRELTAQRNALMGHPQKERR